MYKQQRTNVVVYAEVLLATPYADDSVCLPEKIIWRELFSYKFISFSLNSEKSLKFESGAYCVIYLSTNFIFKYDYKILNKRHLKIFLYLIRFHFLLKSVVKISQTSRIPFLVVIRISLGRTDSFATVWEATWTVRGVEWSNLKVNVLIIRYIKSNICFSLLKLYHFILESKNVS